MIMAIIKRLEVTFNEKERKLIEYLESQDMRTATFIKHVLTEHMNNNSTVDIDYNKIRQIVKEVLSEHKITVNQSNTTPSPINDKSKSTKQNPILNGFAKKI